MAQTLTSTFAGPIQKHIITPRVRRSDSPVRRAAKHKATSDAQKRGNQKRSYEDLELLLAANYPAAGSAVVFTLTYDDDHLPKDRDTTKARKRVNADLVNFRGGVNRARKKAGLPDMRAFWSIEVLTSVSGRWHVHMIMDSTGHDYDMIRKAWKGGDVVEIEPLRVDDDKNHLTLAKYMTKEAREAQDYISKPNTLSDSHTRNILKPERETRIVPDDYELAIPEGAVILHDEVCQTAFASWRYVKFRTPAPAVRARRKRRRR